MENLFHMLSKKKIIVTGGTGRFGKVLKRNVKKNFLFPTKKQLNILKLKKLTSYLKKEKPDYVIHLAGLSRPMTMHESNISKSIKLNIIGTSNLTVACEKYNIKLIYFSSSYVYPGTKGNYNENDPLLPCNNYAWSKLGGECAVQMYKNSLILRVSMTEKPFVHKLAYSNMITNFIFHEDFIKLFLKVLNYKGILNIGGKTNSVFNFVKLSNPKINEKILKNNNKIKLPMNSSMNLKRLKNLLKNKQTTKNH